MGFKGDLSKMLTTKKKNGPKLFRNLRKVVKSTKYFHKMYNVGIYYSYNSIVQSTR